MGLHVSPFSAEEFFGAFDGEIFCLVYHLATTVITMAGIALGIFVGKARAHGAHHFVAHKVFTGNQIDATTPAKLLAVNDSKTLVVSLHSIVRCFRYDLPR